MNTKEFKTRQIYSDRKRPFKGQPLKSGSEKPDSFLNLQPCEV